MSDSFTQNNTQAIERQRFDCFETQGVCGIDLGLEPGERRPDCVAIQYPR
jgi:hypothetical protein